VDGCSQRLLRTRSKGLPFLWRVDAGKSHFVLDFFFVKDRDRVAIADADN